MRKDPVLINIYLKIHNKRSLTLDDLRYLAQYSPECFEKTCRNVVYNIPETKPIMEPVSPEVPDVPDANPESPSDRQNIEEVLTNLKHLEADDFPVTDVDADEVKNLLGNLYMELLFPHNDQDSFFNMADDENTPLFDKRV